MNRRAAGRAGPGAGCNVPRRQGSRFGPMLIMVDLVPKVACENRTRRELTTTHSRAVVMPRKTQTANSAARIYVSGCRLFSILLGGPAKPDSTRRTSRRISSRGAWRSSVARKSTSCNETDKRESNCK
jgi:hypothetical protein